MATPRTEGLFVSTQNIYVSHRMEKKKRGGAWYPEAHFQLSMNKVTLEKFLHFKVLNTKD